MTDTKAQSEEFEDCGCKTCRDLKDMGVTDPVTALMSQMRFHNIYVEHIKKEHGLEEAKRIASLTFLDDFGEQLKELHNDSKEDEG